jgi:AcrR family transcriptional regulator
MKPTVKRNYSSALRESQARETRRAIVGAGARLFVSDGFGRTTIDAIAVEAGVSRKTVFTSVGGKVEILKLAIDWAVVGDDEPVALADRPEVQRLKRATDPRVILFGWIDMGVPISARVHGLFSALVVAAGIDDDARDLLAEVRRNRMGGARAVTSAIARVGGLREGLSDSAAADIAWLYSDPLQYETLVVQRGWSKKRFTAWVKETMAAQLLA